MKRIFIALFVLTSFVATSQESVLLRINYNKGDKYLIKLEQVQNMGMQGGINMDMTMDMTFTEVANGEFISEAKITAVKMDMIQGTMVMSYDSSKSEDELDATAKAMKAQVDPMMQSAIITTINNFGKTLSTKIEPANPTMSQFADQSSSIIFPEEKVSVGSTWTEDDTDEETKMKISRIYTVDKIADGMVYITISGNVSSTGEVAMSGVITGKTEIEIATGAQLKAEVEVTMNAMGTEVKVTNKSAMIKQ